MTEAKEPNVQSQAAQPQFQPESAPECGEVSSDPHPQSAAISPETTFQMLKKIPGHLQIHALVAYVCCTILFFVWHWSGSKEWWWIYPFFFFAMSIACHYYIYQLEWRKAIISILIIGNICAFASWGLMSEISRTRQTPLLRFN
jgi:hypothetical protein